MRNIPKKNYLLLLILLAATIIIVVFACDIYESRTKKQYISAMNSFVTEIKLDDLSGYTLENSPVVIFVSDKTDIKLEEKEVEYKQLLTEYDLQNLFVYLNITDVDVLDEFKNKYNFEFDATLLPILVVIDEGIVVDVYSSSVFEENDIVKFLKKNEVIEND